MSTVAQHYEDVLAEVYSWMFGGFENGLQNNRDFFDRHRITPSGCGLAIDLGAGCGFQSIALAQRGFSVMAIDLSAALLQELNEHKNTLDITAVQKDLLRFDEWVQPPAELIVCMTDTLLHLSSKEEVELLFSKIHAALEQNGTFILTFRDLSVELSGTDRFIPVRSDEQTIFSCFLEYEPDSVNVHDIVYQRQGSDWCLKKSVYTKLRLSTQWVCETLQDAGFSNIDSKNKNGLITLITTR